MVGQRSSVHPSGISVVVADDHAILRVGIRSILHEQTGIQVVGEAANGDEAIEVTRRLKPDVLLLDLSMPGNHEFRVLKELIKDGCTTRILVLTMHDDQSYLRAVVREGGAGYLVKRAADSELLTAIRQIHLGGGVHRRLHERRGPAKCP